MLLTTTKVQNTAAAKTALCLLDRRGLYLEIAPSGSRWWRFKYRLAGRQKRFSLGVYPDVGLKKARDNREEMRKPVADGVERPPTKRDSHTPTASNS